MDKITVSLNNSMQTNGGIFEGWGTSLCWWANRVGFSEKLVKKGAELFFSEEGLGLNIMRYNIGGGDDPSHNHITRTDSEMPGWWKYDDSKKDFIFNSDTDKNQLAVLEAAYKAAGETAYVEAFSNSPPYYMTVSGCTSGNEIAARDNLKKESIIPFADYLAEVCRFLTVNKSIRIRSLAAMNEPFSNYWKKFSPKQEGCFVSPGEMQSSLIIAVSEALKAKKLNDIIVTATDETNTMLQYISMKMLSEEALNRTDRISTHTYMKAAKQIGELARENEKNIWMSETDWSGVSGENSDEMGPALWLGEKIIEDINTLSPSAWVIWQIVASYISGQPDNKGRYDMRTLPDLTKGFWGTAFADIDKEEYILTKKYYAFGQFSRYIRPGMTILHTDNNSCLAAVDRKREKLVIVAINTDNDSKKVIFETEGLPSKERTLKAIRTSGNIKTGENWKEISSSSVKENSFSAELKKHSITTFILT